MRAGNLAARGKSILHPGQARLTRVLLAEKPAAGHSNFFFQANLRLPAKVPKLAAIHQFSSQAVGLG